MLKLLLCVVLVVTAVGCDDKSGLCTRQTDCPAGYACADGVCSPMITPDSAPRDQGLDHSQPDVIVDQLVWPDQGPPDGDGGPATCQGNNNGQVERKEMVVQVPSQVTVTRGSGVVLNLLGAGTKGKRSWDLSGAASDDKDTVLKLEAVPTWTAKSFPTATYASLLMANFGLWSKTPFLGVFEVKPTALQLIGGASAKANHTRFSYSKPLDVLRFPVVMGDSYSTEADITGFTELAVPVWMHEKYSIKVLDRGKVTLFKGFALDALLVSVLQEAYPKANPLLVVRTQAYVLVAECYGTVARIIADKVPVADLSKVKAKERWRLAAP